MSSFRTAIDHLTPVGGKVLELGGGTGVLSHFAAQKAAHVWCVERNPELVTAAREFLDLNETGSRIDVVQADARDYLPPERVDVVICEMLHTALIREKQIEILASFQSRYHKHFGPPMPLFVPEATLLAMQPVEQSFNFCGFEAPIPLFQLPGAEHPSTRPLCEPTVYATVEYNRPLPTHFAYQVMFTAEQAGRVNAVRFFTKNIVAFQEEKGTAVEWSNQYLVAPIKEPIKVEAGDVMSVFVDYMAGCQLKQFLARVVAQSERTQSRQREQQQALKIDVQRMNVPSPEHLRAA